MSTLHNIVQKMIEKPKGILAADESGPTIEKRFRALGIENTEDQRRAWRELLFTSPGLSQWLGGVILFEETINQRTSDDMLFVEYLTAHGILAGLKPDKGAKPLPGFEGQTFTQGLDGLRERLVDAKEKGISFTKWRHTFRVLPSLMDFVIQENAAVLAVYALLVQEAGLVPIVEPEVLIDGSHSIGEAEEAGRRVLTGCFAALEKSGVDFSGIVLKPSMVTAGAESGYAMNPEEVAAATMRVIEETIPPGIPVAFLSGGQTPEQATANLDAINTQNPERRYTFSFSRALQGPVMEAWQGKQENVEAAQRIFSRRCELASLASIGKYTPEMENGTA